MKKFLLAALLSLSSFSATAGVPVIDPAHIASAIASAVQQYGQSLQEFLKLEQQYQQMKQLEQITTGQRSFTDVLNNPLVMKNIPNDLTIALANVKSDPNYAIERSKFEISSNPKLNALYDKVAGNEAVRKTFFAKTANLSDAIKRQQVIYERADDPAKRAAAANKIASDSELLKADTAVVEAFKIEQAKEIEVARIALHKNIMCQEFSNSITSSNCK